MDELIANLREDRDLLGHDNKPTDMIEVKIAADISAAIDMIEQLRDDIISMRGCE